MSIELVNILDTVDKPKQKRCEDCKDWDWFFCCCFHRSNTRPIGGSPKCILRDRQFYSRKWWKFWRLK